MDSIDNTLTIEVYSSGLTLVYDESGDIHRPKAVSFDTFWPGGLYGAASLYVPRDVLNYWIIQGAKRIVFRNGMDIVWEGEIDQLSDRVDEGAEGKLITATGYWGAKLMRRSLRRYYVDTRMEQGVWRYLMAPAATGGEVDYSISRSDDVGDVLLFQPQNHPLHSGDLVRLDYVCPTGEAVKKVVFDVDFQEGAGDNFTASLNDATGGAAAFSKTADYTGTGESWTAAAAAATTLLYWQLSCGGTSTPTPGDNYLEVANMKVYAWTNNSGNFADNVDEVAKDIVAEFTDIFNSDTANIDTPGTPYALVSFLAEWDTVADILTNAAAFGDGATPPNLWGFYLDHSEKAATPDGLPVLYLKQYTALTSYDYGVRLNGKNLVAPVSITRDFTKIQNWVIASYQMADGGIDYITPDDDATLKDTTSITNYGQRNSPVLSFAGEISVATATQLAKRHLAKWKDPIYVIDGPITVQGYILDSNSQPVPACRIQAGKRIRILDYLDDLSGTGLTMHISGVSYNADDETCQITTGALDDTDPMTAQWGAYIAPHVLTPPSGKPPEEKKKKKKKRKK